MTLSRLVNYSFAKRAFLFLCKEIFFTKKTTAIDLLLYFETLCIIVLMSILCRPYQAYYTSVLIYISLCNILCNTLPIRAILVEHIICTARKVCTNSFHVIKFFYDLHFLMFRVTVFLQC